MSVKTSTLPLSQMLTVIRQGLRRTSLPQNIAVVGAGMAGLVAASLLKEAGHRITILEASDRVGGRVHTLRAPFTDGHYLDAGAMRIPDFHTLTLAYIQKFGLPVNPFINSTPRDPLYVNGVRSERAAYERNPDLLRFPVARGEQGKTAQQLADYALEPILTMLRQDPLHNWPQIIRAFDKYSMDAYLRYNPFGRSLSLGAIDKVKVLLATEGFPELSFLEILREWLIFRPETRFYEITGGNDRLPRAFLPFLQENIRFRQKLTRIMRQGSGAVTLTSIHTNTGESTEIDADAAIITIPFTLLNFVEVLPHNTLSYSKWQAIHQLHYVASTKIGLQFRTRFWERDGIFGGQGITDLPIRFSYYPSHGFGEQGGVILASYTWEDDTLPWDCLSHAERVQQALENLARIHGDQVYREFVAGTSYSWAQSPFSGGAFSMFKPEQETELSAALSVPEGNLYFAGEHTSHFRSWIQGAIESGIRAAYEVNERHR